MVGFVDKEMQMRDAVWKTGDSRKGKKEEGFQTTGKQWDLVQQINSQSLEEALDQKSLWPSNLTPPQPNFRHGQPWH